MYLSNGLLYEVEKKSGRYLLLSYENGPAMTLTSLADSAVTRIFCTQYDEPTDVCAEMVVQLGEDWKIPDVLDTPIAAVECSKEGKWTLRRLEGVTERILIDGAEVVDSPTPFKNKSVVQICGKVELITSLAPWFQDADLQEPGEDNGGSEAIISSEFQKKEEEEKTTVPELSGTERAYRANRALRRALLSAETDEEIAERKAREERYDDKTAKRLERYGYEDFTGELDRQTELGRIRDMDGVNMPTQAPKRRNIYTKPETEETETATESDGTFRGQTKGEHAGLGFE